MNLKVTKTPARSVVGVTSEIEAEFLPNTSLEQNILATAYWDTDEENYIPSEELVLSRILEFR
jgi:hypothetical protein